MTRLVAATVALFFVLSPLSLAAEDPEFGEFLDGDVEQVPAGTACNGGTCSWLDALGQRHQENCPTSGGPVCKEGEGCKCRCIHEMPGTSWSAMNVCVKIVMESDPEEPTEENP